MSKRSKDDVQVLSEWCSLRLSSELFNKMKARYTSLGFPSHAEYVRSLIIADVESVDSSMNLVVSGVKKSLSNDRAIISRIDSFYHVFIQFIWLFLAHTPEIPSEVKEDLAVVTDNRLSKFIKNAAVRMLDSPSTLANLIDSIASHSESSEDSSSSSEEEGA